MRNAKIICTLGPASESLRVIEDLVGAGMTVARINASHGDVATTRRYLERVREIDARVERPIATVLDLQGPEIRTAACAEPVELSAGQTVNFRAGAATDLPVIGLTRSITTVESGDRVLLDDGRIEAIVRERSEREVAAEITEGGTLGGRKGVNIPGVDLDLEMVTEKDRDDLALVGEDLVDFVAASFVRDAEDIMEVHATVEEHGEPVPIIAKIERADAVTNMDEIIEAAAAIMVARGDLGVECPMEDVPIIQKRLIRRSHQNGVPVVTATEMLDSMIESRRPTRAEASDVANAVLDGTDAVMLSAETAVGDHPVRVVETMDRIIRQIERSDEYAELREQRIPPAHRHRIDALARSGRYLARDLGARAILAVSETGYTALKTAKFRPEVPIVAATLEPRITRELALSGGVYPCLVEGNDANVTDVIQDGMQQAMGGGLLESGDTVVVIVGLMRALEGGEMTNTLKVHVAAETLAAGRVVVPGRAIGPVHPLEHGDLSDLPEGAIVWLSRKFDHEFTNDPGRLGGIITAEPGLTGYPAIVAREYGIPMISNATKPDDIVPGTDVTVDAERGVVYEGAIAPVAERQPRAEI